MNKKKPSALSNVTERDITLLCVLGAVLVLAFSYFFVFQPNNKKAEEVKNKNVELSAYVNELDVKIAGEAEKRAEIVVFRDGRTELLGRFPNGMTHERAIEILADLEKETELFSSQASLAVNNVFFNQTESKNNRVIQVESVASTSPVARQGVAEETYPDIMGYKTTLSLAFTCTDEQLTEALDFINQYETKMSVENITVGYDETSGNLAGTMNLCIYSVDAGTVEYEEPVIEDVGTGVVNIFGSKEVKKRRN